MGRVLISLIIPVYNVETYLQKCLDSLLAQDLEDVEIILINDGSTDNSLQICQNYQKNHPKIKLIDQANKGLGGARNAGIRQACGQYVWCVDSDDYLPQEAISKIKSELKKYGYPEVLIFNMTMVDQSGLTLGRVEDSWLLPGVISEPKTALVAHNSACNKIIKRQLFVNHDLSFPEKVWYEDLRTIPKVLFYAQTIARTDYDGYCYLMRQQSITHNHNQDRNLEIIDAIEDLVGFFKQQSASERYHDELEFLAFKHLIIHSSVRLLKIDYKSKQLRKIIKYYNHNFQLLSSNPYRKTLGLKEKLIELLIRWRAYRLLALLLTTRGNYV